MAHFLFAVYAFRGQDDRVDLTGQEMINQQTTDFVVQPLLPFRINLALGFLQLVQDGQGFGIDVMI